MRRVFVAIACVLAGACLFFFAGRAGRFERGEAATEALVDAPDVSVAAERSCEQVGAIWLCNVDGETTQRLKGAQESQAAYRDRMAAKAAADKKKLEDARRRQYETARPVAPSGGPVQARLASFQNEDVRSIMSLAGVPAEWWPEFEAIAWCESRWRPDAIGDGGSSVGMWQLWRGWFHSAGFDGEAWSDPVVNARTALYVRLVRGRFGGRGGWSCADHLGIE